MLDEKHLSEIKKAAERLISSGQIIKEKDGRYIEFFLNNSRNSLESAKLLFNVSSNKELQNNLGYIDFNGFLWVINSR